MSSTKHILPNSWCFWVIQIKNIKNEKKYEIEKVCDFSTIEEFWDCFLQLPKINQVNIGGISLFKKGISPAWEDPKNEKGSSVQIPSTEWTPEKWEQLLVKIIGGSYENEVPNPPLCGVYGMNSMKNGFSVSLWYERGSVDLKATGEFFGYEPSLLRVKDH